MIQLSELSLKEKVGQIFCVFMDLKHYEDSKKLVQEYAVGSIHAVPMDLPMLATWLKELHRIARIPLLITADMEPSFSEVLGWGTTFPSAMGLSAVDDEEIMYRVGLITGKEAQTVGINWAFTPVLDVNSNPRNPIINTRSYGDTPERVIRLTRAYIKGLKDAKVLPTGKHFPGHGNTAKDSHLESPVSQTSKEMFRSLDLQPFADQIHDLPAIMTAHIIVSHLDSKMATFSKVILQDLLRQELGFTGMVVSDALMMGAVVKNYAPSQAIKEAFLAGCDMLIVPPQGIFEQIETTVKMVEKKEIPEERLNQAVERILAAKRTVWEGVDKYQFGNLARFKEIAKEHAVFAQTVAEKAITLVSDESKLLPLTKDKIGSGLTLLVVGDDRGKGEIFAELIQEKIKEWNLAFTSTGNPESYIPSDNTVIIAVYSNVRFYSHQILLSQKEAHALAKIIKKFSNRVVVVSFGSPYTLADIAITIPACLTAYDLTLPTTKAMVRALLGEVPITGKLPIKLATSN